MTLGAEAASWWVIANTRACPCGCCLCDTCLLTFGAELPDGPTPLPLPYVVAAPPCTVGSDAAGPVGLL